MNQPYYGKINAVVSVNEKDSPLSKIYFADILGRENQAKYEWAHAPFTVADATAGIIDAIRRLPKYANNCFAIAFPHTTTLYAFNSGIDDRLVKYGAKKTNPAEAAAFSSEKDLVACPLEILVMNQELQQHITRRKGVPDARMQEALPALNVADPDKLAAHYASQDHRTAMDSGVLVTYDPQENTKNISPRLICMKDRHLPHIAIVEGVTITLYRFGDPQKEAERETNIYFVGKQYSLGTESTLRRADQTAFTEITAKGVSILADEMQRWAQAKTVEEYVAAKRDSQGFKATRSLQSAR